jgi:hypothetical protein
MIGGPFNRASVIATTPSRSVAGRTPTFDRVIWTRCGGESGNSLTPGFSIVKYGRRALRSSAEADFEWYTAKTDAIAAMAAETEEIVVQSIPLSNMASRVCASTTA